MRNNFFFIRFLFVFIVFFLSTSAATEKSTVIVVLGHPGAGKGTFAQSLNDKGFVHISLGDFLRNEFRNGTDVGLRWKEEIRVYGILAIGVVKEVTADLVRKINSSPPQVYILDGHIRTLEQAQHLDGLLHENMNISPIFVYINTNKDECLQRILNRRTCSQCHYIYNLKSFPPQKVGLCDLCGSPLAQRDTDNAVNAKNRIDTYEPYLIETVEYYKNKNVLIEFNGNLPIRACIAEYRRFFP